ncbi:MAG TPA: hypothetical protein VHY19_09555 [Steroidobacteraceae bacterium]|jgi:hypothetical protein|nr:hypothetical protein [Steroidobacteraceae bacterium]
MVSGVGASVHDAGARYPPPATSGGNTITALEGRIELAKIQLNDWTTCVSAKTPKGQAAIQKLSGEIGAIKDQITKALQASAGATSQPSLAASPTSRPGSVDVWA